MSRNDLIGVARIGKKYVVLKGLNADTQWSRRYARYAVYKLRKGEYFASRSAALVAAHDLQKKEASEYGVREL